MLSKVSINDALTALEIENARIEKATTALLNGGYGPRPKLSDSPGWKRLLGSRNCTYGPKWLTVAMMRLYPFRVVTSFP